MPNTASAKKRLRQNVALRMHNKSVKSNLRNQIRVVRESIEAGDADKAENAFRLASQKLDRAGAKNIIHRNKAARLKSRLSKGIKSMKNA